MNLEGTIKVVGTTAEFGAKGFRKRDLVITTEGDYPQHILIEFVQDKVDLLNAFKVGDCVNVTINIRGREWTNPKGEAKYFNSITGWKIEKSDAPDLPPMPVSNDENLSESTGSIPDLPF